MSQLLWPYLAFPQSQPQRLRVLHMGEEQAQSFLLVEKGQMLSLRSPAQEVWVGQALVWETGAFVAAANWGCVCRLPGSSVSGGTSSSDPRGLAPIPREGALARNL